jgi:predicted nucleic acid-binding Zn ribbon protein
MTDYNSEQIILELQQFFKNDHLIPTRNNFHISEYIIRKHFGSWNNALRASNIPTSKCIIEHECKHDNCDNTFLGTFNTTKQFCSNSCSASHNNKRRKKPFTKTCLHCNTTIHDKRKFCSNTCQHDYRTNVEMPLLISEGKVHTRSTLVKYLKKTFGHQCSMCQLTTWQNHPIMLELDHIDGNAANNLPNNLRLLCPNCHSTTDTWKGRNRGKGRKSCGLPLH